MQPSQAIADRTILQSRGQFPIQSSNKLAACLGMRRIDLEQLADAAPAEYEQFDIQKPGGSKWRHIDNPSERLKEVQRRINRGLLATVELPATMLGGVRGRSLFDNAKNHLAAASLVTLDVRDFFPNTHHTLVFKAFRETLGCSDDVARLLTRLVTFDGRVPQGAPTSSMVANLAIVPMHLEVVERCLANGLVATFFVDDIAISGDDATGVIPDVVHIARRYGYSIHAGKKRVMRSGNQQVVTGLGVNSKRPTTSRDYREAVRRRIVELAGIGLTTSKEIASIRGRIGYIRRTHPADADAIEIWLDRIDLHVVESDAAVVERAPRRACRSIRRPHDSHSQPPH